MARPLRFLEKTREGKQMQDKLTPRSDPCYAQGLGGSASQRDRTRGRRQTTSHLWLWKPSSYNNEYYSRAPSSEGSQKAFVGVSHSSKGSGAIVGYLYLGIRAKGLMSVTSPHSMVKDATTATSDP